MPITFVGESATWSNGTAQPATITARWDADIPFPITDVRLLFNTQRDTVVDSVTLEIEESTTRSGLAPVSLLKPSRN